MFNFSDQGGQFRSSAKSCIAPQGKPSLGAALGQFCARDNTVLGRDSHSRRLPAELNEVLLFILTQVSPWSPGGVAGACRSQPGKEGGAVGIEAANPSSSFPGQKWGLPKIPALTSWQETATGKW